ncbi:hypothetical protein SeMB42_g04820, partial [Synchytrium endobioticum]
NEWATTIDELRDKRAFFAKLIGDVGANTISVSPNDAADHTVLSSFLPKDPPLTRDELPLEPTSHMSVALLHYVLEYNALLFEIYRFKFVQLTKVLDEVPINEVPMSPEVRQELEAQMEQVRDMMKIYLRTEYKYARKLKSTAPHSGLDFKQARPPSTDFVCADVVRNEGQAAPHGGARNIVLDLNESPPGTDDPNIGPYHELPELMVMK